MLSLLANLAVMQHDDIVCALNRRQAVRHDYRSATTHHPCDCLLNQLLGLCIDRAGRLIKNQKSRIESQRPRKRDQLFLSD